jgi:hypothetical protein
MKLSTAFGDGKASSAVASGPRVVLTLEEEAPNRRGVARNRRNRSVQQPDRRLHADLTLTFGDLSGDLGDVCPESGSQPDLAAEVLASHLAVASLRATPSSTQESIEGVSAAVANG